MNYFRCTVPWLVPVKSAVKLPKLRPKKRKRRKLDALNVEFNITEDSLTLFKPSVADVDPTQIHKKCAPKCTRKILCPFQLNKKESLRTPYYIVVTGWVPESWVLEVPWRSGFKAI